MKIKHSLMAPLVLIAATGCSSEIDKAKGEILSGCIQGGAPRAVCTCAYERLSNHYGEEKLAEIAKLQNISDAPHDWIKQATQAGIDCRTE
jgi:hypothetical protein